MKLIIDTDPGIDDALAIAYAHAAPEIELLGLTTVFGNTFVEQSSRNARYLCDLLGLDIPVAEGASLPRGHDSYEPSAHVHGPEGFGDLTEIPQIGRNAPESAAAFLCRMVREHPGEIVICAIGPLTNIADALELDPDFAGNVGRIVIMGGAVDCPGNVSRAAEANIFHDPVAADVVMASGAEIVLVGLDVTLKTLYRAEDFAALAARSPKTGGFLNEISRFYLNFYREIAGHDGCGLHDSTAVIACTHPHLFRIDRTGISIGQSGDAIGATRRSPTRPKVSVCLDLDVDAVMALFTDTVASLP